MEIGNNIKSLRVRKGLTQEAVASALGVLPQTVSKWETGATAPDIALLPAISAYLGATIDELFALTDEQRLDRIRSMLLDNRDIDEAVLDREAAFLRDVARREPENAQVWVIQAWMENYKAGAHRRRAEAYAKEALEREPENKDAFVELAEAAGVSCPDWYVETHGAYIDWYKDFLARHPDNWRAYMWLMDALRQDRRYDEAAEWCDKMARIDHTFRVQDYRALIALDKGEKARALELWEQMVRDFPDEWMAWANLGDGLTFLGEYGRALECYREARRRQTHSRAFTDPLIAMARIYELTGDIPAAIAMNEELIAALRDDWNTTRGEEVDEIRREIDRLRAKL